MEQNLKFISQAEMKLIRETSTASKNTDHPELNDRVRKKIPLRGENAVCWIYLVIKYDSSADRNWAHTPAAVNSWESRHDANLFTVQA